MVDPGGKILVSYFLINYYKHLREVWTREAHFKLVIDFQYPRILKQETKFTCNNAAYDINYRFKLT